ncbi:hypothetical protein [Streptomyces sp. NPDC023838]|uniref:hypothetical protein n=1 Tax=Streptomyces sp. NPDC023838 TaxID=3154325 RepID=UPI0033E5B96C
MREALEFLGGRDFTDEALVIQLGTGREELARLRAHLMKVGELTADVQLKARDLHVLHSALTASATMFLESRGVISQEAFYRRTGFFRENFDALALGIVEAASEATR